MLAVCVIFSIRSGMLDAFAAGAGSSDMFKIESSQLALEKVSGEGGAGVRGADGRGLHGHRREDEGCGSGGR
jgi:hypothetical protein